MATLREMIDAFIEAMEGAGGLGLGCIKGYPDFRNPNLNPPLAAVFYAGSRSQGEARRRIGQSTKTVALTVGVYCTNEVQLFEQAQRLAALRAGRLVVTAGTDHLPVEVTFGDDERLAPAPDDPAELRHSLECPVLLSY